ncbi:MAG: thioredoxin family protein [Bradymonadia bacterium]
MSTRPSKIGLLVGALMLICLGSAHGKGIEWIKDDYAKAMELAKKKRVPLVVDLWAPWCHTCLSMKAHVFTDKKLEPFAKKFVWLALDTDKPENAEALDDLPVEAWPTLYVASPVDGSIQGRLVGAATPEQIIGLLKQGQAGHTGVVKRKEGLEPHLAQWRAADALMADGEYQEAAMRYRKALTLSPQGLERRQELVGSLVLALQRAGRYAQCLKMGGSQLVIATRRVAASAADFVQTVDTCAVALERVNDDHRTAIVRFRKRAAVRLEAILAEAEGKLTLDDHSDAMRILRTLMVRLGLKRQAQELANTQLQMLDAFAFGTADPKARMMYSWPRTEVYLFLDRGMDLVDHLRYTAQQLPEEYDAHYRLAWLLHRLERHDEALKPAKKALALAYGPRRARLFTLLGDIHKALKQVTEERAARMGAVATLTGLPMSMRDQKAIEAAQAALDKVPQVGGQ